MLKHILLVGLLSFSALPLLKAQSCGNDEKYHLPYKNTYVKEPLVTENEYRVAKRDDCAEKLRRSPADSSQSHLGWT